MQLISKKLPMDHNLFLFGDDHEGSILRYKQGWEKLVDMIHSGYGGLRPSANYCVDHGDPIEAIMIDDKRYDGKTTNINIMKQIENAIESRRPIAKKTIAMVESNHPEKLWRFGPITQEICKELNIPYGTWSAVISYKNSKGSLMYKHFATHGYGSINTSADDAIRRDSNMKLSLKRKLKDKVGDCALMSMGHTHKILISKPSSDLFITSTKEKHKRLKQKYTQTHQRASYIHPDHRWYVNTGSFLKLYGLGVSGYAERFGYNPMELGFAIVKVRKGIIVDIEKVVI